MIHPLDDSVVPSGVIGPIPPGNAASSASTSSEMPRFHPGTKLARPTVHSDGVPVQDTLDDLGVPLCDVTFVVLDLETTGTSARSAGITEIGAVKVRGGQVVDEFQTLVDPGQPIPPFITALTGISDRMVADAPTIGAVLPEFWKFIDGTVLVAHNAGFDVSFLRAAGHAVDLAWPGNTVLDTVALARKVVTKDEAPNNKLATLARLFGAEVTPDHRALSDARATVDVLHALLGRLAPWGITHLEDLSTATDPVAPHIRAKRFLADGLPSGPGVYLFRAPNNDILYVGTSVNVRRRVRSYFTASEKRSKMREMLTIAASVTAVACATPLEANIRELRLIASEAPRYNRRSTFPARMPWIRLTNEPHPRLSIVTAVAAPEAARAHIGPFASRKAANEALEALYATFPIRQCRPRLPLVAGPSAVACHLAELGRCDAPCLAGPEESGAQIRARYTEIADAVTHAMTRDPGRVVQHLSQKMGGLVAREDFEGAAQMRDTLTGFLSGAHRAQQFDPLARCAELIAALPTAEGGWEIVVVRYGRLAATAVAPAGTPPGRAIDLAKATAEHVEAPVPPATAAHPEETLLVLKWLDQPGVRLVEVTDPLSCPRIGAGSHADLVRTARQGRRSA